MNPNKMNTAVAAAERRDADAKTKQAAATAAAEKRRAEAEGYVARSGAVVNRFAEFALLTAPADVFVRPASIHDYSVRMRQAEALSAPVRTTIDCGLFENETWGVGRGVAVVTGRYHDGRPASYDHVLDAGLFTVEYELHVGEGADALVVALTSERFCRFDLNPGGCLADETGDVSGGALVAARVHVEGAEPLSIETLEYLTGQMQTPDSPNADIAARFTARQAQEWDLNNAVAHINAVAADNLHALR